MRRVRSISASIFGDSVVVRALGDEVHAGVLDATGFERGRSFVPGLVVFGLDRMQLVAIKAKVGGDRQPRAVRIIAAVHGEVVVEEVERVRRAWDSDILSERRTSEIRHGFESIQEHSSRSFRMYNRRESAVKRSDNQTVTFTASCVRADLQQGIDHAVDAEVILERVGRLRGFRGWRR